MSNKITEKYFDHRSHGQEAAIFKKVAAGSGFAPGKEIFRGRIYDKDKIGSLIHEGVYRGRPAVLKLQFLRPELDELDMIGSFNGQNRSGSVRLPVIYEGKRWDAKTGFGYLLMERIEAPPIYKNPLASREEMEKFLRFYEEYKSKALNKPFFPPSDGERSSLVFTVLRVSNWARIADSKGELTGEKVRRLEIFFGLADKHLPTIKMRFVHGHLSPDDIFALPSGEFVLMSNLFWSYRPEYYDAAFHLWWSLKSLQDLAMTPQKVISYIEAWKRGYERLSFIKKDDDFERKFHFMILERVLGAILIDIENQNYPKDKHKHIEHLSGLFIRVFDHYGDKLKKYGNKNRI